MRVLILKSFPYAADGIHIRELAAESIEDIASGVVEGLRDDGFVGDLPAEDPPAEDLPAEDPPAEDPPAEDAQAEDPPAEDLPAEDPPSRPRQRRS